MSFQKMNGGSLHQTSDVNSVNGRDSCSDIEIIGGMMINGFNYFHGTTNSNNPGGSQGQAGNTPTALPLQDWIKHASISIDNINGKSAVTSPAYLQAALKIAKCLTRQIIQAEKLQRKYGLSQKLDLLPISSSEDWANHVVIHFNRESPSHVDRVKETDELKPASVTTHDLGAENESSGKKQSSVKPFGLDDKREDLLGENAEEREVQFQFSSFLDDFNADELDAAIKARESQSVDRVKQKINTDNTVDSSRGTSPLNPCFDITSAEIRCPESDSIVSNSDAATESAQRIYYLGLVLYELFSGGHKPPVSLYALALFNGAFVSLSTLTLVDKKKDDTGIGSSYERIKRRHSSIGSTEEAGLCQISCEYLKLIGVKASLCHLILDMLNCIYGDCGGKYHYSDLTDVACELQLMIDRPRILQGLDVDKVSSMGLQLDQIVISREKELETIRSCYKRCINGSYELSLVSGVSGTGKSWLAMNVGHSAVITDGGFFLMAKFDQMKQSRPFSVLAEAFEQYCDILICQQDCDWAKLVVTELYVAIGPDICDLAKVIRKLGELMNIGTEFDESIANQNCGNAMQRFHYLLCQFVEVIATHSPTSLVFCVDDLQWADDASLAVLGRIMKQKQHRCFFLGCYRGDEMKEDHSFWKMLASVNAVGVNTTHVKLSCMCHEEVNEVISDLLCLSPRLVRPLSQILYMKTNGNVLFFVQLLLSLYHDGLLHLDFKKQRWTWDEEKILSMKLPDNIAIWFTLSIGKLPVEVQLALHVVSMFGASIQLGIVKALESQLGLKLVEPLKIAAKNGFVTELNDSHRFTHDRIQEASYNLIGERDRRCNHLTYGKFLVELAQETNDGDLLFIAVSQINHGGPDVVSEPADYVAIARHNLAAGKRAMSTADFSTAYSFFENGISFLPTNHWQDHYDLSLEMFNLCAKCALASGHLRAIHSLSFHVLENTKNNFHDTLDVQFTNLSLLALTSKMGEALQLGLTVISKLGEGIPIDPSNELIQQQATKIQNMISGVSEEQLLNYKVMDNSSKSDAMMFLARLQVIAWMISSPVHPLIILKMMEITITWGLSSQASMAFACFGNYLAKLDDLTTGCRFASLAKSLLKKREESATVSGMRAEESVGDVFAITTEVLLYCEPAKAANEMRVTGEASSFKAGDVNWICLNRQRYYADSLWVGTSISTMDELVSKAHDLFLQQQHSLCLAFSLIMQRTLALLTGRKTEKLSLQEISENPSPRLVFVNSFYNMYLSFLMNHDDLAECCKTFLGSQIHLKSSFILFNHSYHCFIVGLVSFRLYRVTSDLSWAERGARSIKKMQIWTDQGSPFNFLHKLQLMQAEERYSFGDTEGAKSTYKSAISSAHTSKYINEEALSYELAARFYLDIGDLPTSLEHFIQAHEKYEVWGAVGKANQLFGYINSRFAQNCTVAGQSSQESLS